MSVDYGIDMDTSFFSYIQVVSGDFEEQDLMCCYRSDLCIKYCRQEDFHSEHSILLDGFVR